MYYIYVEDNKINGYGTAECSNIQNIEVSEEIYNTYKNDNLTYIWNGSDIVVNPDYEEQKECQQKDAQIELLKEQLDELDLKTIRALRAINAYTATEADMERLQEIEQQAQNIRREIARLSE